jgi:hypothetical protein
MAMNTARAHTAIDLGARAVAAVALLVDAQKHWHLAPTYDLVRSDTISQGTLFRVEAVMAVLAAAGVLVFRNLLVRLAAFGVAAGGLGAVLLYRYVNVGAIGPLPSMYEPIWYHDKTVSTLSQVVAIVAIAVLVLVQLRGRSEARALEGTTSETGRPVHQPGLSG